MFGPNPPDLPAVDCPDPETVGASIRFCPTSAELTIRFVGARTAGLPPWSMELLALASGAKSVHIDLTAIDLVDPERTASVLRAVLESDHRVRRVTFEHAAADASRA